MMILRRDKLEQQIGRGAVASLTVAGYLDAATPRDPDRLRTTQPPSSWKKWAREIWARRTK
jgi:hypothetical protein